MPMEEQVVSIFSGVNGYLDDIKVTDVTRFEETFLAEMRNKHKDILDTIGAEEKISDETDKKLRGILDKFTKAFA
jgi:F-type H+/Na+-transporting ATPase subunit alpha